MSESSQGRKQSMSPERMALLREMERLRTEWQQRRMRRVQVIQDLHS